MLLRNFEPQPVPGHELCSVPRYHARSPIGEQTLFLFPDTMPRSPIPCSVPRSGIPFPDPRLRSPIADPVPRSYRSPIVPPPTRELTWTLQNFRKFLKFPKFQNSTKFLNSRIHEFQNSKIPIGFVDFAKFQNFKILEFYQNRKILDFAKFDIFVGILEF